ncbi:hypothetical protein M3923_000915 [Vibrio metschnikovii]|nr:hypothetical protein [Vibrio metschnikovii]
MSTLIFIKLIMVFMIIVIFIAFIFLFSNNYRDRGELSYQDILLVNDIKNNRGDYIKTIKKDLNIYSNEEICFYFNKDEVLNYRMENEIIIFGDGIVSFPGDGNICYKNKDNNYIYATHRVILTFYNDDEVMYGVIDLNVHNNVKNEMFIDFRYGD